MKFISIIFQLIASGRPIHWVKNLALFAALIFSGNLFVRSLFWNVILAFFSFSFAASATYFLNDIADADFDKSHPVKKDRPIASKKVPMPLAILSMSILILFSLYIASRLNILFFWSIIAYFCLQVLYSFFLKNAPIIDILIIATGFIIRVYAGAFVINAHLSVWFLLCVVSIALFLASGKRRAELNILDTSALTRKSLINYKKELLNSYVTIFANSAWMSWTLYTFFESPKATLPVWLFLAEISKTTTVNKLLMITIPIVIFGIMRYEALIFEGKSEAPEKLLLTDKPLVTSVILWTLVVVFILYGGVSTLAP